MECCFFYFRSFFTIFRILYNFYLPAPYAWFRYCLVFWNSHILQSPGTLGRVAKNGTSLNVDSKFILCLGLILPEFRIRGRLLFNKYRHSHTWAHGGIGGPPPLRGSTPPPGGSEKDPLRPGKKLETPPESLKNWKVKKSIEIDEKMILLRKKIEKMSQKSCFFH